MFMCIQYVTHYRTATSCFNFRTSKFSCINNDVKKEAYKSWFICDFCDCMYSKIILYKLISVKNLTKYKLNFRFFFYTYL